MSAWLNSWGLSWGNSWGSIGEQERPPAGNSGQDRFQEDEEIVLLTRIAIQLIEGEI